MLTGRPIRVMLPSPFMVSRSKNPAPSTREPRPPGAQLGEHAARAMILEGAARAFAERGFRATAVEDVLAAAGVARRTFYRLFGSKEDVAVALYQFGTELLLDACRQAVSEERDPLRQLGRCIDAHLTNAREFGRLIFVLGGEAQRHESALHVRRMQVHDELVAVLVAGARERGVDVDPLLLRGLVFALEGLTRLLLAEGDDGRHVPEASLERVRQAAMQLARAALGSRSEVAGDP